MNKWIISAFLVAAVCVGYSSAACSVDDLSIVTTCSTNFGTAFAAAGQDKDKVCAAFEAFITCINKVSSGCKNDPSFSQAIDQIKSQVGSFGCTSSASGVHMSVVATIIALLAAYIICVHEIDRFK